LLRDDFKSPVETIDTALDLLAQIPAQRKIVVMGEVSDPPSSSGPIYRRIGRRMAEVADQVIVMGRHDQRYSTGLARGGLPRHAITMAGHSFDRALAAIPTDLGPGDIILIKGRHSERLGRIALALMGRKVRCTIAYCPVHDYLRCDACKMLELETEPYDNGPPHPDAAALNAGSDAGR
jgi:alanine racemase